MIRFAALRDRYRIDRSTTGAVPGLTAALVAIGWSAVGEPSADELAGYVVELVEACVSEHHDAERLVSEVARLLRDSGPLLDGGLAPVAAYVPAAEEMLERYVRGDTARPNFSFPGA